MTMKRNETHSEQVKAWESNLKNLSIDQSITLYEKAIEAIEDRSLNTLSPITIRVVVDRALQETKEKFPILAGAKIENDRIFLRDVRSTFAQNKSDELILALRSLLIELLNVLGNITADVLTVPLHREIAQVTPERIFKETGPQKVHMLRPAKTNREES